MWPVCARPSVRARHASSTTHPMDRAEGVHKAQGSISVEVHFPIPLAGAEHGQTKPTNEHDARGRKHAALGCEGNVP